MRKTSRYLFAFALLLVLAIPASAVDDVKETILPNGLRVVTKEVHAAPVVTVQVWYHVGSRSERPGITGISHLVEHMLFKGSKAFPKGQAATLLRRKGGIQNGATSIDYTNFWELASSQHLEFAIKVEADRMANSLIDPNELKAERVVVRSELEGRENSPGTLLWQEVTAAAFKAHPYQWPIIGWRSDVEGATRDDLYRYYKTYYHPNNSTLVIVGDFETSNALALAKKYFGGIPKGSAIPVVRTVEPPQEGQRRVRFERQGTIARVMIGYHIPAITSKDTYPLDALANIMSAGKSSRLEQALVEKGIATDIGAGAMSSRDPNLFYLIAVGQNGITPEKLEKALLEQVEILKSTPVSDEELMRAKNQLEASFIFQKDSVTDQAEGLGYYDTVANWRLMYDYVPKIKAVTKEDIQRVARGYLTEKNSTVGWFVPTAATSPAGTEVSENALHDAEFAAPAGYSQVSGLKSRNTNAGRMSVSGKGFPETTLATTTTTSPKPLSPKKVDSARVKPFRTALPNGITVIVQENHSNPTIAIEGNLKAGGYFDPDGKKGLAKITAAMLKRGTKSRTSLKIAEELDFVGASASVTAATEGAWFSSRAISRDFRLVTDVLSDMLRNPTFPEDELEKLRSETLSGLKLDDESPDNRANRKFTSVVFPPGHPYHTQTVDEDERDLKSIKRQNVVDFYQRYYAPDTMVIVIVGDVKPQAAVETVKEFLGAWQAKKNTPTMEISTQPVQAQPVREIISMMDKSQVDIILGHAGMIPRKSPDFYSFNIANRILGQSIWSSRLGKTIREKMGLAYDIYSAFDATLGAGPWYVQLGTNPANADKAIASMKTEIVKLRDKGVTKEEFSEAIEYTIGVFPIVLEKNDGIARTLLNAEIYGLGMNYIQDYAKIYRSVTIEQVNAAAKKYLRPEHGTLVIAGPYKEGK
ncbi:MAG: pitrilysin family protein [Armatimonadota bacterium]|nr:pitrilysin family protein [Armatimonadota bacterium]